MVEAQGQPVAPELRLRRTLEARNRVFQLLASGAPLLEVLDQLAVSSEKIMPDMLCSVLLLEPGTRRLRHGAAPSLPEFYTRAVDGMEIGHGRGSCGTAAYTGARVIVEDVMTHPYWADFRLLAATAGVRACWSEPILSARGEVLGTFAMYYRTPRRPSPVDLDFIHTSAYVAGVAIERAHTQAELALHRQLFADERIGLGGLARHDRFVIKQRLGAGGMGVVYRALDRQRGGEVAVKVLRRVDGEALYRFKQEFRALADLAHPNLVSLHELLSTGDEWFITMELVDGVPFNEFLGLVRPPLARHTENTRAARPSSITGEHLKVLPPCPVSPERLRPALRQLVEGVAVLHRAGRLHRDIKPSNVLVTAEGRVVLLDFGLVAELATRAVSATDSEERMLAGTPTFMSPEQAAGEPLDEASDWYAVGVMLYEALTGKLPFEGEREQLLWRKVNGEPPPPSTLVDGVPADLDALCSALVRRDPAARPSGDQLLAALGPEGPTQPSDVHRLSGFVGRFAERRVLHDALLATRLGKNVTVFVHGQAGVGKSALVRQFLAEVGDSGEAVVLAGCCYERESMPYRALDSLVDALSNHLLRLSRDEVTDVLPRDISALTRLFPVFQRVSQVPSSAQENADPQQTRRRAFVALRYLLRRLVERRPVVLFIDDLQWGDFDSAPFLLDLMHHPDAPPLLFVAAMRREDEQASLFLRRLRQPTTGVGQPGDVRDLFLEPLPLAEATQLARSALHGDGPAEAIAREAGGHPLFVLELARSDRQPGEGASLDSVVAARLARMPEPAARLLAVVAVAGHPLVRAVAVAAAGVAHDPAMIQLLRIERLIRTRTIDGEEEIVPHHQRVQQVLLAGKTPAEVRALHAALARALETARAPDPQRLVEHWRLAGDDARAAVYALAAAERSERALAFDRAAHYYELALALGQHPPAAARQLKACLAAALESGGRLEDAARVNLEACEGAAPEEALERRRSAMESLLLAGRLQEGLAVGREVAAAVGLDLPRSHRGAVTGIAWRRFLLRSRGLRFTPRRAEDLPPATLRRLDVARSLSTGLAFVEPLLAMTIQTRYTLEVLRAGEPYRVSLALASELASRAALGRQRFANLSQSIDEVRALAESTGQRQAVAFAVACAGFAHFFAGRWLGARKLLVEADGLWREQRVEMRWAADVTQAFLLATLVQVGEPLELTRLLPIFLREALERGDLYAASALRSWRSNVGWLMVDRPAEAREQIFASRLSSSVGGFHLHHFYEMQSLGQIDLYVGDPFAARARYDEHAADLESSRLLKLPLLRTELAYLRARAALATGDLELAERLGHQLAGERLGWARGLALLIEATLAHRRGDRQAARRHIASAEARFTQEHMALYAAVARVRHGELVGDESRVEGAVSWMESQGVVSPERIVGLYAPGFD